MIFDRHANLKYKYGNRHFWCRGYYVDTVGRNKKAIEKYIKNQLQEDIMNDQLTIKEYIDPLQVVRVRRHNKGCFSSSLKNIIQLADLFSAS